MKRKIPFEKYEAAGNDFIILDFFEFWHTDINDPLLMARMCDRHFGVGADGIIALCPHEEHAFEMKYLNSDGRFSSFCGNGSRAISHYYYRKYDKTSFDFVAADGLHEAEVLDSSRIRIRMKNLTKPVSTPFGYLVDSGSPHLIKEVDNPFGLKVKEVGKPLRDEFGSDGVNVNFIAIEGNKLLIATYERGVEDETLACGTGIVASAFYNCWKEQSKGKQLQNVMCKGGSLQVELTIHGDVAEEVFLIGPVHHVFSGTFFRRGESRF